MIDVHFHCLPGVDDGPETWDEAVALCQAAFAEGTERLVATPHVLRDPWINEDPKARAALLAELNERLAGKPEVLPGCEYWFGSDMLELLEEGAASPLTRLNGSRYLLVEFAAGFLPPNAEATVYEAALMGVVPVIAHPERNRVFVAEPQRLARLVGIGAIAQVTAGSLLGEFGRWAKDGAEELLRRGLVHVIASDAHDLARRPARMARVRETVRKLLGAEVEEGLLSANPSAIVADQPLPWRG